MAYLIHYNKNHSKANGQFISGDGDGDGISNDHKNQRMSEKQRAKANKQIYKWSQNRRKTGYGSSTYQIAKKISEHDAIKDAAKDEGLRQAVRNLKNAKVNKKLKEPNWRDDPATVKMATAKFKKDWPDWDKDPDDHKMFGYYLEEASEKSKSYAKMVSDYNKAVKKDSWNKAYDAYVKEAERVAREFCGPLADKPFQGSEYYTYGTLIKSAIQEASH